MPRLLLVLVVKLVCTVVVCVSKGTSVILRGEPFPARKDDQAADNMS